MGNFEIGEVIGGLALGFGLIVVIWLVCLVVSIFSIVCTWRCFTKMGTSGWKSIVPIYKIWTLCKCVHGNGAMMFTWIIPIAGPFFALATYWKMYKGFGKSGLFCVLGIFFPLITMAICAFDKSTYSKQ